MGRSSRSRSCRAAQQATRRSIVPAPGGNPMKSLNTFALLTALMIGLLAVAACSTTGDTSGTTDGGSPTATATVKPAPTGVPDVTLAYCQGLMTLAEAN